MPYIVSYIFGETMKYLYKSSAMFSLHAPFLTLLLMREHFHFVRKWGGVPSEGGLPACAEPDRAAVKMQSEKRAREKQRNVCLAKGYRG